MSDRFWTIDEANLALDRVADAVDRAQRALHDGRAGSETRTRRAPTNGHGRASTNGHGRASTIGHGDDDDAAARLSDALGELERDGIVVRDLDRGLVDFPARSPSGRQYLLCWVVGEPAVEWWHWPEDGFAGRTPITDLPS